MKSKHNTRILQTVCLCLLVASCSFATESVGMLESPQQATVDAMASLIQSEDDFDVNSYFTVLNHLSVEPGYVLDYVYLSDHLGGKPIIYARPEDQPAYTSYAEYVEAIGGTEQRSYEYLESAADYLEHIEIDDTTDGYFQFVVLLVMGDQFDLSWHGAYNDTKIVCDHNGLESALEEADAFVSAFDDEVPADVRRAAGKINFEPRVEFLDETSASVRFVTFTKWGGFAEVKYTISREFPHTVTDWEVKTLVEYNCGVMF